VAGRRKQQQSGPVTTPIRVLIVDDDALVRAGLRTMLRAAATIEVIGEAGDGAEVLGALDRHRADVILLDVRMPNLDGLDALELVRSQPSPPAVLMLTTFDTDEHVLRALRHGAAGFLVKDTPPTEIVRAIELVAAGESMLSPSVTRRRIERLADSPDIERRHAEAAATLDTLSPRERDIAEAIAQGKANATIADDLHLSVSTVKNYVSAMLAKLALDNRVQIALLVQDAQRAQ
jgi:DNA-binding NarL/FixJ family response regulator